MIIERIEELLAKDSRSQKDLCDYTGIKTSTLNNWLKRKTEPPANYIIPICEFFKVSCEYLLTGSEQAPGNELDELVRIYNNLDRSGQRILIGKALDLEDTHGINKPDIPLRKAK